MNLRTFFSGSGQFKPVDEIVRIVCEHKIPDVARESPGDAKALLIFKTSKQQTWLVAGKWGLYCVLDDLNRSFTRLQWFIPYFKLIDKGGRIIGLATHNYKERTGLLDIGDRRGWLFSKSLFSDEDIKTRIEKLITRQT